MALSKNSKIIVSDITTALNGKIDTAGTGLSKSGTSLALATVVTAGNAGPTANATLSYGGTFTVPYVTYDAYGRVTGRTNRTMTMPAAPSSATTATNATILNGFSACSAPYNGQSMTTTVNNSNGWYINGTASRNIHKDI